MINTRLLYTPIKNLNEALKAILELREHIDQAIYMKAVNEKVYVYGNGKQLLSGIECLGREEDYYHHDQFKLIDFNAINVESETIKFSDLIQLENKLVNDLNKRSKSWFRLELDPNLLNEANIYFFDNLEK